MISTFRPPTDSGRNFFLARADAVLAGDRPAAAHGSVTISWKASSTRLHFLGVLFVGEEGRMQVAVAHVTEDADLQVVPLGQRLDEATMPASSLRGTVTSSRMVVGRDAGERGERGSSRGGERSIPPSSPLRARRSRPAARESRHDLASSARRRMAVAFHEQDSSASRGRADLGVILDAGNGGLVEELERAWMIECAMMAETVSAASSMRE